MGTKPFLAYPGGKAKLASKIVKLLPPHTVYCEPYFGAGSVYFARPVKLPTNGNHFREVINDIDEELIGFYRTLQNEETAKELIFRLESTPMSRAEFERAKNGDDAWSYFVRNRQSFSANGRTFAIRKKNDNSAFTWQNKIENLRNYIRLKYATIECLDALEVIKRWDSPQTCFYIDPPYPNTSQEYKHTFTAGDLEKLCQVLERAQGSFVLSGYKNDIVPSHWPCKTFEATMSISSVKSGIDKRRIEYVWVVDRSNTMPADLKKVAQYYGDIF